ncbi:unnamed protein product [Candida verbasci]|uniref:BZIP domain-containing protein n=1 Tax=Candida verbasci TaxID=1227364 RepID=A0A9W4X9Y2_9ASCO|nr:unnamed protein product [Candida verbasci]
MSAQAISKLDSKSTTEIVSPCFKTSLAPRKRAKTDEEKEQRRVERILRNRRAAHASREKKRKLLESLEENYKKLSSNFELVYNLLTENQKQLIQDNLLQIDEVQSNSNIKKRKLSTTTITSTTNSSSSPSSEEESSNLNLFTPPSTLLSPPELEISDYQDVKIGYQNEVHPARMKPFDVSNFKLDDINDIDNNNDINDIDNNNNNINNNNDNNDDNNGFLDEFLDFNGEFNF